MAIAQLLHTVLTVVSAGQMLLPDFSWGLVIVTLPRASPIFLVHTYLWAALSVRHVTQLLCSKGNSCVSLQGAITCSTGGKPLR